ncbi:tryptophan halogenase family protein [Aquisalinus flavus]|uniref:Tryptophan halogenase n=1 Tax=Aquisalinus flavus TaxID=1526572 RepID=A0A8J2V4A6_9PROT|nr:tryptophan halogenase family protein [Aquisalinus flavus]MBD0427074.1 tryptophan 7-halogenase [Aquisalinus flavus]UNE46899.1 tryptophan 7-halogenase [Aquisalinus flavus]GGC98175.1 tryptophan halogenase [Aquisalinus flavus]
MIDKPKRKIVIAGGGTAGWMAAAALARALGGIAEITLVESEDIGTVGVGEATIPQIKLFNAVLGLDENEFLRATHGTMKLGIEFDGWGAPGARYMHAFGGIGMSLGMTTFHQYWLRAHREGRDDDLWRYSLNARAAYRNSFSRLDRVGTTPLQGLAYAFHFDAARYACTLRQYAEDRGVSRKEGRIIDVPLGEGGHIAALRLDSGEEIGGDLFIDCTGFRAVLIGQALGADYVDWTHWLPCDRAVAVPSAPLPDLPPYTRAQAQRAGWQWRIPLQHRTGNGHVYCSDFLSDDEAAATLIANLETEALGDPRQLAFTTGHRETFWKGNCIALGLAAGFMEPLESTSIHLVQSGISRLINIFPTETIEAADVAEYNRQTVEEYRHIRDFLILHYHANGRCGEAFWDRCRAMQIPESLQRKYDLFRHAGRFFREDEELFTLDGWVQVMIGQGVMPDTYHPLAGSLSSAQLDEFRNNLDSIIAQAVAGLPPHREYIAQHCAAPGMAAL